MRRPQLQRCVSDIHEPPIISEGKWEMGEPGIAAAASEGVLGRMRSSHGKRGLDWDDVAVKTIFTCLTDTAGTGTGTGTMQCTTDRTFTFFLT